MGDQPPTPHDDAPAPAAGAGAPRGRIRRPWIVRLARPILCTGTLESCPYRTGLRHLLCLPALFPPLVLLSAVVAQRFSDSALGDSGTARPWHLYILFAVIIPIALLCVGWLSCMVLEHMSRHVDPRAPRVEAPGWATSFGVTVAIDAFFILTLLAAVVLALRPLADTWPLISHVYDQLDETPSTGAVVFQWALELWLGALVLSLARRIWRFVRPRHPWRAQFAMIGALLDAAALAFIVLSVLAYYAAADTDPSSNWARGVAKEVPEATFHDPVALANQFRPRLALDRNEPWQPISVESVETAQQQFVVRDTSTSVYRLREASLLAGIDTSRLSCRTATPCYQIDLTAFGGEDCSADVVPDGIPGCSSPTVYARVLTAGANERAFPSEPLPGDAIDTIVEYWVFYGYDRWEQQTPAGLFSQHHDGDWEGAFVAFSPARVPLWVAYTAHCGGVVKQWSDVRVFDGTHPYVFVAKGSHANYPTEAPQTPDWLGCAGRAQHSGRAAEFLDSLANIREQVRPDDTGVLPTVVMADTQPLITAPLWWGTVDTSVLSPPVISAKTLAMGTGPESPGCKPLWRAPIATVYCDRRWDASDVVPDDRDAFCSRWKTTGLDCGEA
jgi:hypothetical protein